MCGHLIFPFIFLEDNSIIIEQTGDNMLYYMYSNGELVGFKYNDTSYYYIKNNQNDVVGILDNTYNVVAKYTYDSWGAIISITDVIGNDISNDNNHIANINPFRYRCYYYDKETQLYYLNSRYYNPTWCRFINMDSYGGEIGGNILSHNTFVYALNNPIVNYDNDGNFAFAIAIPCLVKGAIALVTTVVAYCATKELAKTVVPAIAGALNNPYVGSKTKSKEKSVFKIQTKAATQTSAKVLPISQYAPQQSNANKPCTTAELGAGDVIRGERLTIEETFNYVKLGGDAMCDNQASAYSVAVKFPNHLPTPEIDKYQKPGNKYYYHYHPDRNSHRHIWFYGSP